MTIRRHRRITAACALALSVSAPGVAQIADDVNSQIHSYTAQGFHYGADNTIATVGNGDKLPSASVSHAMKLAIVPVVVSQEPDLSANPGRPAMATSALLTPVGYAQFENGVLYAAGSAEFAKRAGMEETMRLAVTSRVQLIVSAEPLVYSRTSRDDVIQRSDATGGLQVVIMRGQGARPTISSSYLRLVRGGTATDLDIGGYTNSALLMGSFDFRRLHIDSNGFMNEVQGTVRRAQFGEATAATFPLRPKLSTTLELRYFTEPMTAGHGLTTLLATGYSPHPNIVVDAGVVRGLNGVCTRWQATGGFTYVLPRRTWGF